MKQNSANRTRMGILAGNTRIFQISPKLLLTSPLLLEINGLTTSKKLTTWIEEYPDVIWDLLYQGAIQLCRDAHSFLTRKIMISHPHLYEEREQKKRRAQATKNIYRKLRNQTQSKSMTTLSPASRLKTIRYRLDKYLNASYKEAVTVRIPENLNKKTLLGCKPPIFDEASWFDGCRWIVHSIIQRTLDGRTKRRGYCPLYSGILKKIIGTEYRIYLDTLTEAGIIEADCKYSKLSHESYGFRLTPEFAVARIVLRTLRSDDVVRRLLKYKKSKLATLKQRARPVAHLLQWLTVRPGLELNKEAATEFLDTFIRRYRRELSKKHLKTSFAKRVDTFLKSRYRLIEYNVTSWTPESPIQIDGKGGRVYSRLTNLPGIFRNFLTYQGEDLVSYDIKNSQPVHFLLLLNPDFWNEDKPGITLKKLNPELYKFLASQTDFPALVTAIRKEWQERRSKDGDGNYLATTIMFPKSARRLTRKGFPFSHFRQLVIDGKLYEFMSYSFFGKFKTNSGLDKFRTRHLTKGQVLQLMYSDPQKTNPGLKPVIKSFKEHFALEARIMEFLKRRNYTDFPVLLQKIEAEVLLKLVCRKVDNTYPALPLFSIHDSLITTKQHEAVVSEVIKEEYNRLLGFVPQFEHTELNEGNAYKELTKYLNKKIDAEDVEIRQQPPISSGGRKLKIVDWQNCENRDFPASYVKQKITVPDFADYSAILGQITDLLKQGSFISRQSLCS